MMYYQISSLLTQDNIYSTPHTTVKRPVTKESAIAKTEQKTARFEYHGKPSGGQSKQQPSSSKSNKASAQKTPTKPVQTNVKTKDTDMTVYEDFTLEQLDKLTKKYAEHMRLEANKKSVEQKLAQAFDTKLPNRTSNNGAPAKKAAYQPPQRDPGLSSASSSVQQQPVKQLATLVEKRRQLKQNLKRLAEPSASDLEAFKIRALQTTKEFDDLMKGSRPRINLVVVGHVDAGKSTLVGHLLYKLGQVTNKQMHRNEVDSQRSGKASFKFAWALDETSEERSRGVTIDIALTNFQTPHKDAVLLDAPGHVDFIPAVISGAAQADAAILVVDATRGEFETGFSSGGQTREHTFLVRSLGVRSLVVVVNKMDNVDWSWNRFSDIVEQLGPFLKQAGFNLVDDVQFVAASGLTGDNLTERRHVKILKGSSHPQLEDAETGKFSALPSLVEAIDQMKQPERMVDKPTRVCVTDIFKGMSGGVFLGAKVVAGKIEGKQKLVLLPPAETCDIKQVEARDSKANKAFAGDIVTVVATGVDMNRFYRGCILCDPLIPCRVTNRFQARIIMFQNANTILIKGTPIEVHINGVHESAEVRHLISLLNKNSGELIQKKPRCIVQNSSAIIQLKLSRVVCCELYEDNKDLGRFMIRSYGKTIAAGLITKIKSAKLPKSKSKMKSK